MEAERFSRNISKRNHLFSGYRTGIRKGQQPATGKGKKTNRAGRILTLMYRP